MIITSDGRLAQSAAPSAILLWRHMGASSAAYFWNLAAMTDCPVGAKLAAPIAGITRNFIWRQSRKDNFLSLIDQTLCLFLVQLDPLAIHFICVFIHSKKVAAIQPSQKHTNLALRPINRLRLFNAHVSGGFEILIVHRFELKRMGLFTFLKTLPNAIQRQGKVTTASLKPDLLASIGISLPNRHANRTKVRHNAIFFTITSLKQTQKTPLEKRRPSMSELIPQRTAAFIADLTAAKVRSMLILSLGLVVFINVLNSFRRCVCFKIHQEITPIKARKITTPV